MVKGFIFPISYIESTTADAIRIGVAQPPIDRIAYYAGQYLTLKVMIEGQAYYRSYSLSSTPRLDDHLEIAVKRLPGGLVSNFLHENLKVGDTLEFLRPAGNFYLETATQLRQHIVLIGAGSGITPLMSILRAVLYQAPYSRVSLLYQNRRAAEVMFAAALKLLQQRFPTRLDLVQWWSHPNTAALPTDVKRGRLAPASLQEWIGQLPEEPQLPRRYFLCGPLEFMAVAATGLKAAGVGEEMILQEKFVADDSIIQRQRQWNGPTLPVKVSYGDEHYQFMVPPGSTILEAGLQHGIDLPYSCKRGMCSTCMSTLQSGQVEMEDPEALLDFEVAKGRVLICQAHPLTDDVHLKMGF